jgi:hypothetical protein
MKVVIIIIILLIAGCNIRDCYVDSHKPDYIAIAIERKGEPKANEFMYQQARKVIATYSYLDYPEPISDSRRDFEMDYASRRGSCGDYSVAFEKFVDSKTVWVVTGWVSNDPYWEYGVGYHAWNVEIDSGQLWWWELTWADNSDGLIKYEWLNSPTLWSTHRLDKIYFGNTYYKVSSVQELYQLLDNKLKEY